MEDATFISPRPLVTSGDNYLLKEISCHPQWTQLLIHLAFAVLPLIVDFYVFLKRLCCHVDENGRRNSQDRREGLGMSRAESQANPDSSSNGVVCGADRGLRPRIHLGERGLRHHRNVAVSAVTNISNVLFFYIKHMS